MTTGRLLLLGALLVSAGTPQPLVAQDTAQVRIDATPPPGFPVERWAVDFFNLPATARVIGALTIDADTQYAGNVAVIDGPLIVEGVIEGSLVAINADVEIRAGARIGGSVLVLGGRLTDEPGAVIGGTLRRHSGQVDVRLEDDRLQLLSSPARRRGDRPRGSSYGRSSIVLGLGGTYNRVEGLPLRLGIRLVWGRDDIQARLLGYGVFRTAGNLKGRADIGYLISTSLRFGSRRPVTVGVRYRDIVVPTQSWPLELNEVGWASLLWRRDYRDYFLQRGPSGFLTVEPARFVSLRGEVARVDETSIAARDPWTLFRNGEPWRDNPVIDAGDFTLISLTARYDSRPPRRSRASGWFAQAQWERGIGGDIVPRALPASIREPIPTTSYTFDRAQVDLRRYQGFGARGQLRLRAFWAGSIGRDPLPVQRRFSLGGPDPLNGYGFRAFACNAGVVDPSQPGLCDHVLLFQGEYRGHIGFDWFDDDDSGVYSLSFPEPGGEHGYDGFWFEGPTLVLFTNAGTGWIDGATPSLNFDIGAGIEAGGIGFYVAKAIKEGQSVRVTLRVERRF